MENVTQCYEEDQYFSFFKIKPIGILLYDNIPSVHSKKITAALLFRPCVPLDGPRPKFGHLR